MLSTSIENQSLKPLLITVKDKFFRNHEITMIGKFEWLEVSERQAKRYLQKTGKKLQNQLRKFKIIEDFTEVNQSEDSPIQTKKFQHTRFYRLLISDINYNEMTFYVLGDHCVGPLLGEINRYKFKIYVLAGQKHIELVEERMIAIR